ncbi:CRPV-113 [Crowpox virus]|nr:CRPV-113 [Crowpox virus]
MFSNARKHKIGRHTYILDLTERKHLSNRPPIIMNAYDNSTAIKVNVADNIPYVKVKTASTCVKIETVKEDTPTCVKIETVKDELTVEISMMEHLKL